MNKKPEMASLFKYDLLHGSDKVTPLRLINSTIYFLYEKEHVTYDLSTGIIQCEDGSLEVHLLDQKSIDEIMSGHRDLPRNFEK